MLGNEHNQAIVTLGSNHHMLMTADAATHLVAAYLAGIPCDAHGTIRNKQDIIPALIITPRVIQP